MRYIAKPNLFNGKGMKEFDTAREAVDYLNAVLSDKGVDEKFDYVFIPPKSTEKNLRKAVEDYVGIGKLILEEK
jgi:hypothetical protein